MDKKRDAEVVPVEEQWSPVYGDLDSDRSSAEDPLTAAVIAGIQQASESSRAAVSPQSPCSYLGAESLAYDPV